MMDTLGLAFDIRVTAAPATISAGRVSSAARTPQTTSAVRLILTMARASAASRKLLHVRHRDYRPMLP
jgi:hypothetical protein